MSDRKTPEYIMDFVREIAPEAPELYMASFNEQTCIEDATRRMRDLAADNARLKTEGTPGVMHSVDRAFYDLTVKQRNAAWTDNSRLRKALEKTTARLEAIAADGPECDCEPEGHVCGWPALLREIAYARAALEGKL